MNKLFFFTFLLINFITAQVFAQEGPPPAKVVTTKIIQQEVSENHSFLGLLTYDKISQLSSEVAGLATEVHVHEGDHVKTGDTMISINTDILNKEISLSRAKIEQAELKIKYSEKNFKRLEKIYKEKGVSEKVFDDSFYAYENAVMDKLVAEKSLALLVLKKGKSTVLAPFDGVVLRKYIESGDWVQQGKPLLSLASSNDLMVRVPVAESTVQFIKVGQKVPVTLSAYGQEITGSIDSFEPIADEKTKNIFLKVRISSEKTIAANMSATVFVPTSTTKTLSIIPRDALIKFQGKDFVYSVKEGKAAILPVNIVSYLGTTIGADNPYFVAGMPVVVEGNERLRPDQAVTVAGE